jgi:hypothetical protein
LIIVPPAADKRSHFEDIGFVVLKGEAVVHMCVLHVFNRSK